jgi:hypothetical protein
LAELFAIAEYESVFFTIGPARPVIDGHLQLVPWNIPTWIAIAKRNQQKQDPDDAIAP